MEINLNQILVTYSIFVTGETSHSALIAYFLNLGLYIMLCSPNVPIYDNFFWCDILSIMTNSSG